MSRQDKLNEGQVLLDDLNNYRPLDKPMIETTTKKAQQLIKTLLSEGHIDKTTAKWLSLYARSSANQPVFYTLTKIHKPTLVGRPIISWCSGPTERISAFVDHLIQPIAQLQASYLEIRETLFTSSRGLNCLKLPLFQWTSQAYTQTYHNERALPLYAMHTKNFTKETLQCPYQVFKRKA